LIRPATGSPFKMPLENLNRDALSSTICALSWISALAHSRRVTCGMALGNGAVVVSFDMILHSHG